MMKVKPTTKEQLIHFLLNNISLGTYDERFLKNIQILAISKDKPLTTNQAKLLDKITLRYTKQISKRDLDAYQLVKLPWNTEPIESIPEYTDAHCKIENNLIEIRSPYKKDFINDLKEIKLPLTWTRENKTWSVAYSEYSLKFVVECLHKHYPIIHYSNDIKNIIDSFAEYETAKYWDPTYIVVNDRPIIACLNESLYNAIKDIELDFDAATLSKLTSYGITIDDSVINVALEEMWNTDYAIRLMDFATSDNYVAEIKNLNEVVSFLKDIHCDYVILYNALTRRSNIPLDDLQILLSDNKIPFQIVSKNALDVSTEYKNADCLIVINLSLWGLNLNVGRFKESKVIFLGNSDPVDIK